jgi:HEAT repeat protein
MSDFAPARSPAELVDALYRARRAGDRSGIAQIERLLDHEDPMVREEAISLLLIKWKSRELLPRAIRILDTDKDDGVRAQAAIGLGALGASGAAPSVYLHLAEQARNRAVPDRVRQACAEALSTIAGRPTLMEVGDVTRARIDELVMAIEKNRNRH